MRRAHTLHGWWNQFLTGVACSALACGAAQAQTAWISIDGPIVSMGAPCPVPCEELPQTLPSRPATGTPSPSTSRDSNTTRDSATNRDADAGRDSATSASNASANQNSFANESGPAVGGESFSSAAGYIDSAIPVTEFRLRFDSMYDNNRPDRADFFYPACGCLRSPAAGPFQDPKARGPSLMPETRVDYQELRGYLEWAIDPCFSSFVEVPQRWINPDVNVNAEGLGDINFGFKYAFIYGVDRVATFKFAAQAPTGDPGLGLGTGCWWLEPALLFYQKLADKLFLEAEVHDFIPVAANDGYAGNVLRYGVGLNYQVYKAPQFQVTPVVELVGWTVLSGKETVFTDPIPTQNAAGDTIVNLKLGVRIGFGETVEPGMMSRSDLYIGYGRALTGDFWYKDMFRIEYRVRF